MLLGFDRSSVRLPDSWRLRSKGPLKDYAFTVERDERLDGYRLEVSAGKGWFRLLRDVSDEVAEGGAFQFACHLEVPGASAVPVEWLAVLREDATGDQRFVATAAGDLTGSGRKVWGGALPPREPGIRYLIACSLSTFPGAATLGLVECLREGAAPGPPAVRRPPTPPAGATDERLLPALIAATPDEVPPGWWKSGVKLLQAYFWEDHYARAYGLPDGLTAQEALAYYIKHGLAEEHRPNLAFDRALYLRQVGEAGLPPLAPGKNAWLHWLTLGRPAGLAPSLLFDAAEYLEINSLRLPTSAFEHYLSIGYRRNLSPSQFFSAPWYARSYAIPPAIPAIVHYAHEGEGAGYAPHPDIAALPGGAGELGLERLARDLRRREERLRSPEMLALVAQAALIEPQIMRPLGYRPLTFAPLKHAMGRPARASTLVRRAVAGRRFDSIIAVPHCRLAGSARVAGALARALADLRPDERVLVVSTERPDFERADWFPPGVTRLNLPELLGPQKPEDVMRVLLDLVRGLRARRLVNVNSPTAWRLLAAHGRQLRTSTALYSYLFTWDLDPAGTRIGYPVSALPLCLDDLDAAPTDNAPLARDLRDRYALDDAAGARRFPILWSPGEPVYDDHHDRFMAEDGRPLRCLWAGRFDRQKRLDIVVALARLRPDLTIDVFGKPVIGDAAPPLDDVPPNIVFKGIYGSLDDLALEHYDFFLYTAAWDGLPTVLIDMAMRGMAVLASAVGGVTDLIDRETGWPVADWDDARAYAATLDAMTADRGAVRARAARLRARARTRHDPPSYAAAVARMIEGDARAAPAVAA